MSALSKSRLTTHSRLPVFGPLNITDLDKFVSLSKTRFEEFYNFPCPYYTEIDTFDILVRLGKGYFGTVFLVRNDRKELYAMKTIRKKRLVKRKQIDHALNEKRILQSIDFPFGVRMEFFCKDNSYIYFIMPFITGGEMFHHLRAADHFEEHIARFYAAQIVLGFEYLHNLNLIHRDIKPENILLDHFGYLKITDFGFCKVVPRRTYTLCGTPSYFAPEAIKGLGYGKSVDWWALGVLIFEMNSGYEPFQSKSSTKMMMKILLGEYETPSSFSPELSDLVSKLLTSDVTERLGILKNGVLDVKQHPWFKSIDWIALFNRKLDSPYIPPTRNLAYNFPLEAFDPYDLKISATNEYEDLFKEF